MSKRLLVLRTGVLLVGFGALLTTNCDRKQMRGLLASETILLTREGADAKRLPLLSPLLVKH